MNKNSEETRHVQMINQTNNRVTRTACSFLLLATLVGAVLAGCSSPPPMQKQYAAILAVGPGGIFGQWATNDQSLQALDQSFTKVLLAKGYSVCPIVSDTENNSAPNATPEALDQLAVKLGKESKVQYMFLAVLNQATTGDAGNQIHVNIVSKMFRLGNDYSPDEIIATHEWPEDGRLKTIAGGTQAIIEAIQEAAEEAAERYPTASEISKSGRPK